MNITKIVKGLRTLTNYDLGTDDKAILAQAAGVIEANLIVPERTEFPHWKVAQFWSSSTPGTKVLMVTQDESEISAWPKRSDFLGWVGQSDYTYLTEQWLRKTDWVQDQQDTFPMAMPGQHRADALREEIERLRKHTSMFDLNDAQFDEAVATFLANHTSLNQDGIDEKAMLLAILLNYAAKKPTPPEDIQEWKDQGYLEQVNLQIDREELDGTDLAHPAFWRGYNQSIEVAAQAVTAILDGKDIGTGTGNPPWEAIRRRLIELVQRPVPAKHFLVGPGTVRCGSEGFDAYSKKAVSTAQRLGMVLDEDLRKGKNHG